VTGQLDTGHPGTKRPEYPEIIRIDVVFHDRGVQVVDIGKDGPWQLFFEPGIEAALQPVDRQPEIVFSMVAKGQAVLESRFEQSP
jgi:hypothetical protein